MVLNLDGRVFVISFVAMISRLLGRCRESVETWGCGGGWGATQRDRT